MTNIATKNGSVIVKDGSVAEDCVCCQQTLCGCVSEPDLPQTVTVEFSGFEFSYVNSTNNLADMTGAEEYLAAFINGLTPTLALSFDAGDPVLSTAGCMGTPCAECSPPFSSTALYGGALPVPLHSIRFAFPCTGGTALPTGDLLAAFSYAGWFFRSAAGCMPAMPNTSFYGGNDSFFSFALRFPLTLASPSVCDFANGPVSDFTIPLNGTYASYGRWELPYQTWRGYGNTGNYAVTAGTVTIRLNPLP